jgi:xanthine dehydrogenase large subunit
MNKPVEWPLPMGEEAVDLAAPGTRFDSAHALPHESAALHVTGRAAYTDDLPEPAGTLHAALGLSPVAHGRLLAVDVAALRALPGVVEVITAADIPGRNDCGPIVHDDPILAPLDGGDAFEGSLRYLGEPVFAVIATSRDAARRAAARAKEVLRIEPLPAVLNLLEAHAHGRWVVPPMHRVRQSAPGAVRRAIERAPHRRQSSFSLGGQEQFYLEGQISLALPTDEGGVHVHCSTQHPTEMQHAVAHALALPANAVRVECRRMGGGFGGKESQSALPACVAAVAARRLHRAVKLRLDRDDDFLVTGRRHAFEFTWEVGFDDAGRVLGVEVTMVTNAGCSTDLTPPVMTRAICHFDNAYWLPEVAIHGYCAKTNTQSNTAFRGFGGPQGALAIEVILDDIAHALALDPLDVRRVNFYGTGERDTTPYGQRVEDNVIAPLVARLVGSSGYTERRAAVAAFNAASPVLKKGLALTPVKFGISFNVTHFNQAGALVHVYTDGSVLVNHGGTEMGQGLHTKVAQVVAGVLGLPLSAVRASATDTARVANTSATAASTGSDLNGMAAQAAAVAVRDRLAAFFRTRHALPEGAEVHFVDGGVRSAAGRAGVEVEETFREVVAAAYLARVQLWSDGFYATPGLHWDRLTLSGRPFFYFAYGAAVSEVVIDTTTGEHRVLRADLLHDSGRSLNPAIDLGQVEGAFVQGMGWLTCEELVWHPETGRLLTHAPSTYKIPTANDVPADLRVALWTEDNPAPTVQRSKAVGEPPLLLAFSVFLAIRDAVAAARGRPGEAPRLSAPATPEAVRRAIDAG